MDGMHFRKRARAKLEEAEKLLNLATGEDRDFTEEEASQYAQLIEDAKALQAQAQAAEDAQLVTEFLDTPAHPESVTRLDLPLPPLHAEPRDRETEARGHFSSFGEFAMAVVNASSPGRGVDSRLGILAAASGMQQGQGSAGGFLVPPSFSTRIWEGLTGASDSLLARCDVYTVEGESLTFPANAETSRATGSRQGGVRGYWIAEAAQITSSKPTFRQVKLEPQELACLVYATDKLIRNAPLALEQYLYRACSDELNFLIGDAVINGDGAGKPKGVMQAGCKVSVSAEDGQEAATIVSENIIKMWARLHPRSKSSAVWLINTDVSPQLYGMTLSVGTSGLPTYMPPGGLSTSPYATLMGRPVIEVEYCQTLGTSGDIQLVDLSAYAAGVQGGVNTASSIHLRFDYAETAFRVMTAVDGQPWLASAITPYKGTNTLSPFVVLATRS